MTEVSKQEPRHAAAVSMESPSVTVEKDLFGTVNIKMSYEGGEPFDFVQIQYDHRFTHNAHQSFLAQRIVVAITGKDHERDQLKADLARVEPSFDDVKAVVGALGWLGYSTPEGGEECAARWLELVRTLIRAAGQSKMLRLDAEKLAEFDRLKAESAGLKTGYEAYERVVQGLRDENERLVAAMRTR